MNMTPKEKAIILIDMFFEYTNDADKYEYAKKCALIAVDEIIESEPTYTSSIFKGSFLKSDNTEYWQEVKQEIELL